MSNGKSVSLPVFHIRDVIMQPSQGTFKGVHWTQLGSVLQLRFPLRGQAWSAATEESFDVRASGMSVSVRTSGAGRAGTFPAFKAKLRRAIKPAASSYFLEDDLGTVASGSRALCVELAKADSGEDWAEGVFMGDFVPPPPPPDGESELQVFLEVQDLKPRRGIRSFSSNGWKRDSPASKCWERLRPGRFPEKDGYITGRERLCKQLHTAEVGNSVEFRIVLDAGEVQRVSLTAPYWEIWALDVSRKHMKLFIRGAEDAPVLFGEFVGNAIPGKCSLELTDLDRTDLGFYAETIDGRVPCLTVAIRKAEDSLHSWGDEPLTQDYSNPEMIGLLQDRRRLRAPSPDRSRWGAEQLAAEQKELGDGAFKDAEWEDAAERYTCAINHTPKSEKLLSNRSAAYIKMGKFEEALKDAEKAEQLRSDWSKIFFRKGQALRGLRRWQAALDAFGRGQELDGEPGAWEAEIKKTREGLEAVKANRGKWV